MEDLWMTHDYLINRMAIYDGNRRQHIFGDQPVKILNTREYSNGFVGWVMLEDPASGEPHWVGISSVILLDKEEETVNPNVKRYDPTADIDDIFNEAVGGKEAVLDAEIKRLENRLSELKAAKAVLESL